MTNSQRLSTVRDQLIRWMTDQSLPQTDDDSNSAGGSPIRSESILIRDGFYCGRRFDLGSHRAVWFLEEDELKIYSRQGDLECVLSGEELGRRADQEAGRGQVFTLPRQSERSPAADPKSDDADQQGEIRRAA
jgi:hypothetical protein